jgi:hypothetical protein
MLLAPRLSCWLLVNAVIAATQTKPDPAITRGKPFVVSEQPAAVPLCCGRLDTPVQLDSPAPVASSSLENLRDQHYVALIVPGVRHVAPGAPRIPSLETTAKF